MPRTIRATVVLTTLCCSEAAFGRPFTQPSRRSVVRMSEGEGEGNSPKLPTLPSIQTLLFGLIAGQSAMTLSSEVPRLLAGATPAPYFSVAVNFGFLGWGVLSLAQGFGFGKKDYYDALDDLAVASLARDAGEWALAGVVPTRSKDEQYEVATFAGGCFWGTELHFQRLPGVVATCVGYTQGGVDKPSYAQVCTGGTGHTEGLQITYDPAEISFDSLCEKLLATVDSTALNRVGGDRGTQYRHGIYFHSPAQEAAARLALDREQAKVANPVVTELKPAAVFWPAENYHRATAPSNPDVHEPQPTPPHTSGAARASCAYCCP